MNIKTPVVIKKTSFIDYPEHICTVIFFPGCNLRCPWCHNRELVLGEKTNTVYISLEEALAHIIKRQKILDGVVLSGGEPTLFTGLGELIRRIKTLHLKVKLDTNGLLPGVLAGLFQSEETRPDYIAMDLKTSPERYMELLPEKATAEGQKTGFVACTENPGIAVIQSVKLIRSSGIAHEFRTLDLPPPPDKMQPSYLDKQVRVALADLVGDSFWIVRPFVPGNCIDPAWNEVGEIHLNYSGESQINAP